MADWKKWALGDFTLKRLLKSIISIYVILLILAVSLGDFLIFPSPRPQYDDTLPHLKLLPPTEDSEAIAYYHLPAKPNMPTLLWSHGNAEDIGSIRPLLDILHNQGLGILTYDYPGYGLSPGNTSDRSCYQAIERAYQKLTDDLKVPPSSIIIVGQSVGSGPSCYIAEKQQTAGLILISPISSIYRVAFGFRPFPRDRFPNIDRIKHIHSPLMVIHGEADTIVTPDHGMALAAAHPGETQLEILHARGHNDIVGRDLDETNTYIALIRDFALLHATSSH
ncbi:alpha/beta hydrolase [Rubritalea tangerina]|uniref:Alpha/beta hydrolase n=1 Tax=Rubritalea tangerina TaxID=430798 RepID=A0ABW4ZBV6_9BACT